MILLEYHNRIIEDTLVEKFASAPEQKFEAIETILADFDGVTFHLYTDANAKNIVFISMSIKCWSELKKYGVDKVMQDNYGKLLVSPEANYDVTIKIDLTETPPDVPKFVHNIALLKRHAFAAPFYYVFDQIEQKKPGGVIEVRYRDEESFYLKPDVDKCIVVFSIRFKDADDIVFAKVFLQEYADARRSMSNAPAVSYSQKEPPMELKGVSNLRVGDSNGYVSFALFQPHITSKKRDSTIDNITEFRNYLHYHIKCSKAYMHTRMRNRVNSFLQVLNRSKSEPLGTQKKTATGRTFTRADDPPSASPEFNL